MHLAEFGTQKSQFLAIFAKIADIPSSLFQFSNKLGAVNEIVILLAIILCPSS